MGRRAMGLGMTLLFLSGGCSSPTCADACTSMVESCAATPFSSVGDCVSACADAEAAAPRAAENLLCYQAAGCDAAAVVACARTEQDEAAP